jgi:hypothetical protein
MALPDPSCIRQGTAFANAVAIIVARELSCLRTDAPNSRFMADPHLSDELESWALLGTA